MNSAAKHVCRKSQSYSREFSISGVSARARCTFPQRPLTVDVREDSAIGYTVVDYFGRDTLSSHYPISFDSTTDITPFTFVGRSLQVNSPLDFETTTQYVVDNVRYFFFFLQTSSMQFLLIYVLVH